MSVMNTFTHSFRATGGALCLAAFLLPLAGCLRVNLPLRPTVTGHPIKPEQLHWIQPHQTTCQEVVENWGLPSFELMHQRLFGYARRVDRTGSWELWRIGADPVIKEGTWGEV